MTKIKKLEFIKFLSFIIKYNFINHYSVFLSLILDKRTSDALDLTKYKFGYFSKNDLTS